MPLGYEKVAADGTTKESTSGELKQTRELKRDSGDPPSPVRKKQRLSDGQHSQHQNTPQHPQAEGNGKHNYSKAVPNPQRHSINPSVRRKWHARDDDSLDVSSSPQKRNHHTKVGYISSLTKRDSQSDDSLYEPRSSRHADSEQNTTSITKREPEETSDDSDNDDEEGDEEDDEEEDEIDLPVITPDIGDGEKNTIGEIKYSEVTKAKYQFPEDVMLKLHRWMRENDLIQIKQGKRTYSLWKDLGFVNPEKSEELRNACIYKLRTTVRNEARSFLNVQYTVQNGKREWKPWTSLWMEPDWDGNIEPPVNDSRYKIGGTNLAFILKHSKSSLPHKFKRATRRWMRRNDYILKTKLLNPRLQELYSILGFNNPEKDEELRRVCINKAANYVVASATLFRKHCKMLGGKVIWNEYTMPWLEDDWDGEINAPAASSEGSEESASHSGEEEFDDDSEVAESPDIITRSASAGALKTGKRISNVTDTSVTPVSDYDSNQPLASTPRTELDSTSSRSLPAARQHTCEHSATPATPVRTPYATIHEAISVHAKHLSWPQVERLKQLLDLSPSNPEFL